jgi:transposase
MYGEEMWMVLPALLRQGGSKAALAREFRLNRRTIDRYSNAGAVPACGPRACPAELAPDQLAHVIRRLESCPPIRTTTLYREVTKLGYEGTYTSFNRRVRRLREREPAEPEVRFEAAAGIQVQMDWDHSPPPRRYDNP